MLSRSQAAPPGSAAQNPMSTELSAGRAAQRPVARQRPVPRRAVGVLAAVKRTCGPAKRCRAAFACGSCRAHLLENSPATAVLGCSTFAVAQYRQISLADCKIYLAQVARLALLPCYPQKGHGFSLKNAKDYSSKGRPDASKTAQSRERRGKTARRPIENPHDSLNWQKSLRNVAPRVSKLKTGSVNAKGRPKDKKV